MSVIDLAKIIRERKYAGEVDRYLAIAESVSRTNLLTGPSHLSLALIEEVIAEQRPQVRAAIVDALAEIAATPETKG